MRKRNIYLFITTFSLLCSINSSAQNKSDGRIKSERNCKAFASGKLLNTPKPFYPNEAKFGNIGGKVEIAVGIDKKGTVTSIESVNGDSVLVSYASEAAKKATFAPSLCNGKPAETLGIIVFNFVPTPIRSQYFYPSKLEELSDVSNRSNYYEAAISLTENYQLLFALADGKYHGELALTKGDFAVFLANTLEMLNARAELAKKNVKDIRLMSEYNPYNAKEIDFNPSSPFSGSVKLLSEKYKIVLVNEKGEFDSETELSRIEINEIWLQIFGIEAVPINFLAPANENEADKKMTRGEFAIYLKETLDVLTYKLLP